VWVTWRAMSVRPYAAVDFAKTVEDYASRAGHPLSTVALLNLSIFQVFGGIISYFCLLNIRMFQVHGGMT